VRFDATDYAYRGEIDLAFKWLDRAYARLFAAPAFRVAELF